MSETLIKVENVSKKFCRDLKKSLWYGLKDLGGELSGRSLGSRNDLRPDEFWAVKDISLELNRGECLGLIGRNGAGKTTLLRMLNGLIKPDKGRIEMHGRVGALIALGAGFNPILTGRENIYVNAAVLGFSKKETDTRIDEIVEFAELGDFIDSPIQHYSSGMYVRLGFSIAAHLNPDILLVDEVLAVGDLAFTVRCLNRIAKLRGNGTAVIFVSHNELQVREAAQLCMLFDHGNGKLYNNLDEAFWAYNLLHDSYGNDNLTTDAGFVFDGPLKIESIKIENSDHIGALEVGKDAYIHLYCEAAKEIDGVGIELRFWNSKGQLISLLQSHSCNYIFRLNKGINHFSVRLKSLHLSPGRYRLAGGFRRKGEVLGWTRDLAYVNIDKPKDCWISTGLVMIDADISGPL